MDMLVTVYMGRHDAMFVDTGQLGFELASDVSRVYCPAEAPTEELPSEQKLPALVDKRRNARQRPSLGEVEVQADTESGMTVGYLNCLLRCLHVDHQSGRGDLFVEVGVEDALGHVVAESKIVGVHDDSPHLESMARRLKQVVPAVMAGLDL
tara:strand:- start:821 stop:1276 length:456 start_codon:yes stop_codon:yes gene_type:complete